MIRWLALLAVMAACPADPAIRKSDAWNQAAGFGSHATQASYTANRYRYALETLSLANCPLVFETYENEVSTTIGRMADSADLVDMTITDHGGAPYADAACVVATLQAELAAHTAAACKAATIEENVAEATRHLDAMAGYLEHAHARSVEVTSGLDSGTFTWTLPSACL